MTDLSQRRYDLDWLRIIAFGLLIFYHIGMFYVNWDFHVKSVYAGPAIEPLMKLVNPWRMTVLFLISGIALRYAIDKTPLLQFTMARFWRLFLPLLFGILVIVAPQSWLELLEKGETNASFFVFYRSYLSFSTDYSIIVPTWNHLWYLAYLIVYTFVLIVLYPLVRRVRFRAKGRTPVLFAAVLLIPVVIFALHDNWLDGIFPSTHALVDDWANHVRYFPFILLAFVAAKSESVWRIIDRLFVPACIAAILAGSWRLFVWSLDVNDLNDVPFIEILGLMHMMAEPIYAWVCILAAFGLVRRFANRPGPVLTYMTEAIFPWYILHQTLIVMAGYWLTRHGLSPGIEFGLVTLATFAGCFAAHEFVIRRSRFLRPLFGLKNADVNRTDVTIRTGRQAI